MRSRRKSWLVNMSECGSEPLPPPARKGNEVVFYAWGYYTAAIKGEIAPYVSRGRIEAWIDTRPWARKVWEDWGDEKYHEWRKDMAERMFIWLKQFATVGNGKKSLLEA